MTNLFQIDIIPKSHVLGVDAKHLESANSVGNSNVNLSVKSAETTKSRIDWVRAIRGGHDDDMRPLQSL